VRVHVRTSVIALVLATAFGAGVEYLGSLGHHPWGAVRSLSAPWLLLAFVAGATQRGPKRGAILGLACTYAALAGYGLMLLQNGGAHHLTPGEALAYLGHEDKVFVASLVTAPLFGWFGSRWRNGAAITGALVTAAAFCLEPLARAVAAEPIRFLDVALAEVAVGVALAAVLIRRARSA
jgi:hypothetical protein